MSGPERRRTVAVKVGSVQIGGGAPVVVQSMANTETADAAATARQCLELAQAGSELVRITVNTPAAAVAVPEIRRRLRDAGCAVPLIGDFHYNGHRLLTAHPECAKALDKYRINPGNVGRGKAHGEQFATICKIARDHGTPVRIGVNAGSLDPDLVARKMQENTDRRLGSPSPSSAPGEPAELGLGAPEAVQNECMILSALQSTEQALHCGLRRDQLVISCKAAQPPHLIHLYRELARRTEQPLHLGLTEAGIGLKGLVWSATALAVLLHEGIGDTIRVSLTPRPGGDRCEEVYAACEVLQSLGVRAFSPTVTACPGCGRTTSTTFQALAEQVQEHVRKKMPDWRGRCPGVEQLRLAVMGCVVNGPGESKAAHVGISLPGAGEAPHCPVYVDGRKHATLKGTPEELAAAFLKIVDEYVEAKYAKKV